MTHEEILQQLYDDTLVGKAPEVREGVEAGLEQGMEPETMLFDALIPSLEEVGARFERAHLDPTHDAVRPGRGGYLDAIALRAVVLDRAGEIDGVGVGRHSDGLHRLGGGPGSRRGELQLPLPSRLPRAARQPPSRRRLPEP